MKKGCLLAGLLVATACNNAGSDLGVGPPPLNSVNVATFLDRDGSGTLGEADTSYAGVRLILRSSGGGEPVQTITTDAQGRGRYEVPVGTYAVSVDLASLGDTLLVAAVTPATLRIRFDQGILDLTVRLAYPELPMQEARQGSPGRRVLVRGLVLAGVQSYRDTTSYVQDPTARLRITRVSLRGGLTGNNPGDSVVVLGTISSRAGQPTLDQAIITLLGLRPAPIPFPLTTAAGATANGGVLDAGLVQVTAALITEATLVAPDLRVVVDDGSGPLTMILDSQGGFNQAAFIPGRLLTARGILVPDGTGEWQLKPRGGGDVTVF